MYLVWNKQLKRLLIYHTFVTMRNQKQQHYLSIFAQFPPFLQICLTDAAKNFFNYYVLQCRTLIRSFFKKCNSSKLSDQPKGHQLFWGDFHSGNISNERLKGAKTMGCQTPLWKIPSNTFHFVLICIINANPSCWLNL